MIQIELEMPRGTCGVRLFGPIQNPAAPIVFVFMDAFGPRPVLYAICERLAGAGNRVILPDLFYADAPYHPLDPGNLFSGGDDRKRLMTMLGSLDQSALDSDIQTLLTFAGTLPGADAPIAGVGYCMGGRFSLTLAASSQRVHAAACFHASGLAPEQGPSAHLRLSDTKARIYIGMAGIDPTFDAAETARLAASLKAAAVDCMLENYAGAQHGFVMDDLPAFSAAATARHWDRLEALLDMAFGHSAAWLS